MTGGFPRSPEDKPNALALLKADFAANKHNTKGLFIVIMYRVAHITWNAAQRRRVLKLVYFPVSVLYRLVVDYLLCCHIPAQTSIGAGLRIFHGYGITINANAVLGANVTLRQNVTIGNKHVDDNRCPLIGNNVTFGAGSFALGDITIGDHATIAAGAIVVSSMLPGTVAIGPAARLM